MGLRILVSAGEASGDRYAARLVEALRRRYPDAEFRGCAGAEMRRAGVEAIVQAESLAVVGIVEVLAHIPRIYGEYRKLLAAAHAAKPDLAILTDSPDFHLRVAKRLHLEGVPVFYLVAPQAWAWRGGRIGTLRRNVEQLHCIFPFEESFFRDHGVPATYIGHPLAGTVRAASSRDDFARRHALDPARRWIAVCPGSRSGEIARHMPAVVDAVRRLQDRPLEFILALPEGAPAGAGEWPVHRIDGETPDVIAHSDLALAASGTVAMEAALLGTPMVTFYKVSPATWMLGRRLVKVPFFTMVNLVAGRQVVPELMQQEMTGERLAAEAAALLDDVDARRRMIAGLEEVRGRLTTPLDPMERSAELIAGWLERKK